jgi:hypothetical protein
LWPFDRLARRTRDPSIPTGRQTVIGGTWGWGRRTLSPHRSRTNDVLETLRMIGDEAQALDFARKKIPDLSMANWNFVRMANQGHEMAFYALDDKERKNRLRDIEREWRDFASRVNSISNAGLDGLIDMLHYSGYFLGAQAVEVEVNDDRTDIIDVHPVIPQTIEWELEERNGRQVYIPYQQGQVGKKVSLEPGKANFFWVPTDPDIDDPRGNLVMAPVLQSIDFQLQIMNDLQAVLHRQGWPRNDIEIVMERMMASMPPDVKGNAKKQVDWLTEQYSRIKSMLDTVEPDSDYIHFDDVKINMTQGANGGRSLDVRAIDELVSVQVLNGSKQMGIVTNRVGSTGETESWGSITLKVFTDGIASMQRGSKRLIEEVARLWLRVKGIQAVPVFTHNPVNWENEEQRAQVRLLQQQFWAIAQLMGWCDADYAAKEMLKVDRAAGEISPQVRVSFSAGGGDLGDSNQLPGGLQQKNRGLRPVKNL